MNDFALRTSLPIFLLIGTGFFSRKVGILRAGDERVLSAYVYYFALPALFFVNMAETELTRGMLMFAASGVIPLIIAVLIHIALYLIFGFSRNTLYLLVVTTVFGSHANFGIPFIIFAFPTSRGENLAILAASSISIAAVAISLVALELYKLGSFTPWQGIKGVLKRLSRNPLIIAICSGFLISLVGVKVPGPISAFLHMLGKTTATIAIFVLGMFLYGRTYRNLPRALGLSLLRLVFLPAIGIATTGVFHVAGIERTVLVLMFSAPLALSMIVLSERYDFFRDTIASLILITSLSAGVYLNLWLMILQ